ncbi:unnamed protein product, partial [Closterium sp. Naga37s-1]
WQRQAQRATVQGAVEAALVTYTRASSAALGVTGASRTDAGVHAWGQVAHFTTASPICDLPRMHRALNALLPPAIRVRSLRAVPLSFHARLHPCSKHYHYTVLNSPVPHLLPHRRSTLLSYSRGPLDRQLMAQAARLFEGRRDFAAFANACEAKEKGAVREITRFELVGETDCWQGVVDEGEPSPVFRFEVDGSGFLYRQVRNMRSISATALAVSMFSLPPLASLAHMLWVSAHFALRLPSSSSFSHCPPFSSLCVTPYASSLQVGLLLQIGACTLPPSIVTDLLLSGDRRQLARVAPTAKPQGLSLMRVDYPPTALIPPPDSPPPSLSYFEQ